MLGMGLLAGCGAPGGVVAVSAWARGVCGAVASEQGEASRKSDLWGRVPDGCPSRWACPEHDVPLLDRGVNEGCGLEHGEDETFTTGVLTLPVVSTGEASAITQNTATISGTVNPEGL